jgi:hypothetical protein
MWKRHSMYPLSTQGLVLACLVPTGDMDGILLAST